MCFYVRLYVCIFACMCVCVCVYVQVWLLYVCMCVCSVCLFCNNIINSLRFQLWGFSFGSGRLPGTPGDQVPGLPAHNLICQCYATSRRKNKSAAAACQYLTNQKH